MKNKIIFLIIVLALLFGLIFIISENQKAREKVRKEEKMHSERQQFIQDSLQNIQANTSKTKNDVDRETGRNSGGGHNSPQNQDFSFQSNKTVTVTPKDVGNSPPIEDFSSYINTSIKNLNDKTNIAVTIVDENGDISSSISNSLANIYNQTGNIGTTGLLRSSFVHKPGFQELMEGNSEIIEKLKLSSHTDYIALGKIRYSMRKGTLVDGTFVCTASLTMSIISATQKSIVKSFSCSENGNGVTETQAQEAATEKLINKYFNEYATL